MQIVHIHGFKCAGTTFERILQNNYSDILFIESEVGGKRLAFNKIPKDMINKYSALSSHLLAPSDINIFQFSLIRDPYKRLVSAWTYHKEIVGDINSSFREFVINYNNSLISNYQSKLLSKQKFDNTFKSGWEICIDFDFLFGESFFLGVVEKFDESMVVLENKLKMRDIDIDLSYPTIENSTSEHKSTNKIKNLQRLAYPSIDTDLWLYEKAILNLNMEIEKIKDFNKKLALYKKRCKECNWIKQKKTIHHI